MNTSKPIAIVGIGGIFPGSSDLQQFWHNILNKVNTSCEIPEGRWPVPVDEVYSQEVGAKDKVYSKRACFVKDFELDPHGLDIDQDFVSKLDPLFHLALHAGRDAYLDCKTTNINKDRAKVIIGNIVLPSQESSKLAMDYLGKSFDEALEKSTGCKLKTNHSSVDPVSRFVAGLPGGVLAKALGFGGGSYTLDAACASSLYAISLAMDELWAGRADAVLAGGVSRPDCFYTQMGFAQLHALSPNGTSSPFDEDSNGLVVGEGAGMFMLKRLEDALDAGDYIYGCLKGVGLSNDVDGSLLAPNSEGQLRAMKQAYDVAGWKPNDVDLIECHATGTPVGDAIEFQSLQKLWGVDGWNKGQCILGSVKSNIGHLLTAAGSAALMKVVLSLKEGVLPPTANFKSPKKGINLDTAPFNILNDAVKWEKRNSLTPRRAGVSAFGFGGINAHLLVEEWVPEARVELRDGDTNIDVNEEIEVAITGMETHFGDLESLSAFAEHIFSESGVADFSVPENSWWGAHESAWFKSDEFHLNPFKGFYIDRLSIPSNKFRIPPRELAEILPQQLLMLKVADGAIKDGKFSDNDRLNTSVIVGIGLDLNTTNFHFRWMMRNKALALVEESGLKVTKQELDKLTLELMESAGPALSANRTLGALGGVVASRIAREFRLGGPSFTVSNEECSGLRAVETAFRLLQTGKIKQAVVGAVDLAGDLRSTLSTHVERPYSLTGIPLPFDHSANGTVPADGAAAVVLKPLKSAISDGDKIYAVIKGIGSTTGGDPASYLPSKESYKSALNIAYAESGIEFDSVDMIETHGSGILDEDKMELEALFDFSNNNSSETVNNNASCAISSVIADIGHSGAASGLASLVKAALCLHHEMIPGLRNFKNVQKELDYVQDRFYFPVKSRYWLRNKSEGERCAGVSSLSMDGNCTHIVLEGHEDGLNQKDTIKPEYLDFSIEYLFVLENDTTSDLQDEIESLKKHVQKFKDNSIKDIARLWWQNSRLCSTKEYALSIVVKDCTELTDCLEKVYGEIDNGDGYGQLNSIDENKIFFSEDPMGKRGELAFVYPGVGNHYSGMGIDIVKQWPQIARLQDDLNGYVKDQFPPHLFWTDNQNIHNNIRGVLLAQVYIGCFMTDLLGAFSIKPQSVIGYSLGESTGLLSLKVWNDRNEMMRRIMKSDLFVNDLSGECNAARKAWGLKGDEKINWVVGLVLCPEDVVRDIIKKRDKVYLLIVNTQKECVIGGDENCVRGVVDLLNCKYIPLEGVSISHCDVVKQVEKEYRNFHMFDVSSKPYGVKFYSGAWEKAYYVSSENAADSVTTHATKGFHFPRLIENAYNDGVRIFVEIGPGASCCRMIDKILEEQPHSALYAINSKQNETSTVIRLLAQLIAERVDVDLSFFYSDSCDETKTIREPGRKGEQDEIAVIKVGGEAFKVPGNLLPYQRSIDDSVSVSGKLYEDSVSEIGQKELILNVLKGHKSVISSIKESGEAKVDAHESFLALSNNMTQAMSKNIEFQLSLIDAYAGSEENGDGRGFVSVHDVDGDNEDAMDTKSVAFDRDMCMEFAIGKIGNVLGPDYSEIDTYPTRVRLPDEPMMFVDRILLVEGEPLSLKSGRVVTEHDIKGDAWYLDCNRIPTCVAVEAGQADLFLSGYLGIDFKSKGLAVYRLLDAVVTFYRELPVPGDVIRYDIHIEHFFKHGETYLFRFNFEATVNDEPLLSMKDGCAGFFTSQELNDGKGIIDGDVNEGSDEYGKAERLPEIVPMGIESYTASQIDELRAGNLAGCFGDLFNDINIRQPSVIPDGMMKLVDRIPLIDPHGGAYGQGFVRGEADIHKDDWFLICHFIDDRVMPGTLMYECCMHTLRVYLLRMGWVGEQDELVYQPVPGVASRLKCRGQVLETTKMVTYEISVKEMGYCPEPYVICDALMYADDKAIVKISDMSLRISGLTEQKVYKTWGKHNEQTYEAREGIFDNEKILAFAIGKPSEAFGKPYEIFDNDRKIARLPGPPYKFLDRIVSINAEPWKMVNGGEIEAEYDIPVDAWYFKENMQDIMPFSVLLEIALQPCGWLAAYVGSALTSEIDLCFRNLGGSGIITKPVYCDTGTLVTRVKLTQVSKSGGMIIQHYDLHMENNGHTVYKGNTYFGFFTKAALADQIGIRDAKIYNPTESESASGEHFVYPAEKPYPSKMMRMIDRIELFVHDGGPKGLGFIRGVKDVDPEEWFFKAHFYQDPVCPGSLGLESFLQLLKVVAVARWGVDHASDMETIAVDKKHTWVYRGQVIPVDKEITVEAVVSEIDDKQHMIKADGFLSVDGRVIYQMINFTLKARVL